MKIPKTSMRHVRKLMNDIGAEKIEEAMAAGGIKAAQNMASHVAGQKGASALQSAISKKVAKATATGMKAAEIGIGAGAVIGSSAAGLAGHKGEQLVGALKGLDKALFKQVGFDKRTFGRQLRPGAFGLFVGGAAVVGAGQGLTEVNQANMGIKDPNVYRATPTVPSYIDNGEATGDLVFALHDLRRG